MAAMALAASAPPPAPAARAMAEAVDLAPRGFAAIESPSTWRKMRYPSVR